MYMKMLMMTIPAIQLALATGTYLILSLLLGYKEILDKKFDFLHEWDLGFVYLCIYIINLGRARIMVNSNAVRAGARVGRPDQHVYKVMDSKASKEAPFVLMANTGWAGKFNRAQRGAFNTDEAIPGYLVNTVLASAVFGPAVVKNTSNLSPLLVICGSNPERFLVFSGLHRTPGRLRPRHLRPQVHRSVI